ncbi:hypothetical protein PMAYCL1PPCAC_24418 [Pristionchus mayeri]|uniref:cholesterol 7-desaturase n=1 Tax=Pristionchus mayeri TaxID=1317129 RepID=A0AAN5I6I5_9BILA|nr:hypothetical protein PMAYCL1PPCAC_24418 [Pristionchus mayeri]
MENSAIFLLQSLAAIHLTMTLFMYLVAVVIILIYPLYLYLTKPLNRIKRHGDLGYFFGTPELAGKHRDQQIERLKRIRMKGDLPPVYPNGWYCIAESPQLAPKQILPVVVFGEQLSLIRSEDGSAHLIDSYCPHLGANFNVGGRVVDNNCVQCPFHGWVFSAESGSCTRIPYNDGTIPEQARVTVWPVVERNKHIYVWFDADGSAPEWEIPVIEDILNGQWTYKGRTEHEVACHVQEIPENGADIAHLGYLHLAGAPVGNDVIRIDLSDRFPSITHQWDGNWNPSTKDKHMSKMHLEQVMKFHGFEIPLSSSKLDAIQIGPGIVHMHLDFGNLGKGIVLHHVTPEEPLFQRARFVMYSNLPRWFAKFFMLSEANQFERDVYVWSNKRYVKNPLLVKNDGPIGKHRRWYSQFYSDSSPRLLPDGSLSNRAKSALEW